jgi:hypothetical protein
MTRQTCEHLSVAQHILLPPYMYHPSDVIFQKPSHFFLNSIRPRKASEDSPTLNFYSPYWRSVPVCRNVVTAERMIAVCVGITSICCCYGRVGNILASREIGSRVGLGRRRLRHIGLGSNWRLHRVGLGRRRLGWVGLGLRRLSWVGLGLRRLSWIDLGWRRLCCVWLGLRRLGWVGLGLRRLSRIGLYSRRPYRRYRLPHRRRRKGGRIVSSGRRRR